MATRIFIVDDHYMVIEGLYAMLKNEQSIELMGHALNPASCMAYLANHQPDIILMDIQIGDESGIDLCKAVKEKYPGVLVIGLSTFNQYSFIQKMMENGASGYVLKNASCNELLKAFGEVLKSREFFSHDAGRVMKDAETADTPMLTRREREVLGCIAEGLTNQEIADKLFVSITTIVTHRKHLMTKFNAKNTAMLIKDAAQKGLV